MKTENNSLRAKQNNDRDELGVNCQRLIDKLTTHSAQVFQNKKEKKQKFTVKFMVSMLPRRLHNLKFIRRTLNRKLVLMCNKCYRCWYPEGRDQQ